MDAYTYTQYCESADALRSRLGGFVPKALLILGSAGLLFIRRRKASK